MLIPGQLFVNPLCLGRKQSCNPGYKAVCSVPQLLLSLSSDLFRMPTKVCLVKML